METETLKAFNELIWRKNTYGRIELDSNFKLKLYHKVSDRLCLGSCSAGETELLALAFTIALHKVSNHDSLLFIDSPVNRISDVNRRNFAKKLVSVSENKQLILAFTPDEFSSEIQEYFTDDVIASKVIMENKNEESSQKREE